MTNAALTAAVIVPGIILGVLSPMMSALWMFVGSFCLMARTYRRPWRLMTITCLMPAAFAIASWMVQWILHHDVTPPFLFLLPAALFGLAFGAFRAQSHRIYVEDGAIMAQRTVAYLLVWALAYAVTQLLRASGGFVPAVQFGLVVSTFSSAMLVAMAVIILIRFRSMRKLAMA